MAGLPFAHRQARSPLKWQRNALRKSYASYRLAETGNNYTPAEETGHAVAILKRVYREVVTADHASEWFGLMPPEGYAANLVTIPARTASKSHRLSFRIPDTVQKPWSELASWRRIFLPLLVAKGTRGTNRLESGPGVAAGPASGR